MPNTIHQRQLRPPLRPHADHRAHSKTPSMATPRASHWGIVPGRLHRLDHSRARRGPLARPRRPLAHADVIVVLCGGLPFRAEGAADLYQQGYAPLVWITRPDGPQEELAELGIQLRRRRGIQPPGHRPSRRADAAVQILPDQIEDTEQEIEEISAAMRRTGKHTVIIVTSPEHTRRVRALWQKLAPSANELTMIVRAAPEDPDRSRPLVAQHARHLFSYQGILGLTNVWLGLPVRPHAPVKTNKRISNGQPSQSNRSQRKYYFCAWVCATLVLKYS